MNRNAPTDKLLDMLNMKLTVGQVIAGSFVTLTAVVSIVTYVHSTFQTKLEADRRDEKINKRVDKMEEGFQAQSRVQTEIYGDVKEISGILKAQMAERSGRGK